MLRNVRKFSINPHSNQTYKPILNPNFYIEKARLELNETEARKDESLKLLRERMRKHPFIKSELHEAYLLSALRFTKYSIDVAYNGITKLVAIIKTTPEYQLPVGTVYKKSNIVYLVKNRDKDGCRVLYVSFKKVSPGNFNAGEYFFNALAAYRILTLENETQICGYKVVYDLSSFSIGHMMKFLNVSSFSLYNHLGFTCLNLKEVIAIGLPPYALAFPHLNGFLEDMKGKLKFVNHLSIRNEDIESIREKFIETEKIDKLSTLKVDYKSMRMYLQNYSK